MVSAGLNGFLLGASLIIAIGAQNAFVLRQGLARRHVLAVCLTCSLSDALLILAGVAGLGQIVERSPRLLMAVTAGGAAFLFAYGLRAFLRSWRPGRLTVTVAERASLRHAMAACFAFTFLNPHVYLDTVVLVGGLSAAYQGPDRAAYAAGAALASFAWFFTLGYGARALTPIFARPGAWRVLDLAIGATMWLLAAGLIHRLID